MIQLHLQKQLNHVLFFHPSSWKDNKKKDEPKSLNDLIIEEAVKQYKEGNIKRKTLYPD